MPQSKVRLGGSGLTVFNWGTTPLAYLQTIQDTAPTPVAQAVPVQSITDPFPSEIATALAVGAGTLRLTFYELWNQSVWQALPGFNGTGANASNSLLDVLNRQLTTEAITCSKIIKAPSVNNALGVGSSYRTKSYKNCVIVDVDDGEQINIGTMVMPKGITVMYTNYVMG